jgi:hypothetical protein
MPRHPGDDADAAQLAALGHKAELNRNFSPLAMLGLAFAILNSWTALSASLSLALPSGGSTSVLWGLISKLNRYTCRKLLINIQPLVSAIFLSLCPLLNFYPRIRLRVANIIGLL